MERSGSGKDGLMQRSEGELGSRRDFQGGMVEKRVGPSGREGQSLERRAQNEASRKERYKHDQEVRVEGGNGPIEERRAQREARRQRDQINED